MFATFKPLKWNINRIKGWWQAKSPRQKWIAMELFGRRICELIGIRTYTDMKNYWYTASSGVTAAIYFALNIYTIQYYFYRNEFDKIVECTFLVGAVIGVSLNLNLNLGIILIKFSPKKNLFPLSFSSKAFDYVLEIDWTASLQIATADIILWNLFLQCGYRYKINAIQNSTC